MLGIPAPEAAPLTLRQMWNDCLRYWEPRRILYNVVLLFTVSWNLAQMNSWGLMLSAPMVVAAGLANLCYCAAYPLDLALQHSEFREDWLRSRLGLFLLGTAFAAALAVVCLPEMRRLWGG
jgi:hypothetical protein